MTVAAPPGFSWRNAPPPLVRPRPSERLRSWFLQSRPTLVAGANVVLAGAVAVLEPFVRTRAITVAPRPAVVLWVGVAATLLGAWTPDARRWVRLAAWVAAAGVAAMAGGVWVGAGLGLGLAMADWAVHGRPPLPALPRSDRRTLPAAAVAVVAAAWTATGQLARLTPLLLLLVGLGLTLLGGLPAGGEDRALGRALRLPATLLGRARAVLGPLGRFLALLVRAALWLGRAAAHAVRVLTFSLLSVPAVLLPWLVQRLLVLDPLAAHHDAGSRWITRARQRTQPAHPWMHDPAARPPHPYRKVRTAVVLLLAVPVVVVGTVWLRGDPAQIAVAQPAAFAGDDWWDTHHQDLTYVLTPRSGWNPYDWQRVQDVELATINVHDGRRDTWTPPDCGGCRRLKVWVYGGSTTFGYGQRDDHTIPSELAKIAAAEGYVLDVRNMGVPGNLHFEEAQRFAWDAAGPDGPPDVVVFYDGVNDLKGALLRNDYQANGEDQPVSITLEEFRRNYGAFEAFLSRVFGSRPASGPGSVTTTTSPATSPDDLVRRAVQDYSRSLTTSRGAVLATGTDGFWFWQPDRWSRGPVAGEPSGPDDEALRGRSALVRSLLPEGGVDLSDSLDPSTAPLFYDDVHTNEEAARMVATAMFAEIRPTLDLLRQEAP